jgi:hypothetical protein
MLAFRKQAGPTSSLVPHGPEAGAACRILTATHIAREGARIRGRSPPSGGLVLARRKGTTEAAQEKGRR